MPSDDAPLSFSAIGKGRENALSGPCFGLVAVDRSQLVKLLHAQRGHCNLLLRASSIIAIEFFLQCRGGAGLSRGHVDSGTLGVGLSPGSRGCWRFIWLVAGLSCTAAHMLSHSVMSLIRLFRDHDREFLHSSVSWSKW